MQNRNINSTPKYVAYVVGVVLLALGIATFIHPQIMGRYGLNANTTHSIMTIRALIGGAEIGMGLLMLLGSKVGVSFRARLWFGMFLFCGIVAARLISILTANTAIPEMIVRELIAELVIIGILFTGLRNPA